MIHRKCRFRKRLLIRSQALVIQNEFDISSETRRWNRILNETPYIELQGEEKKAMFDDNREKSYVVMRRNKSEVLRTVMQINGRKDY